MDGNERDVGGAGQIGRVAQRGQAARAAADACDDPAEMGHDQLLPLGWAWLGRTFTLEPTGNQWSAGVADVVGG